MKKMAGLLLLLGIASLVFFSFWPLSKERIITEEDFKRGNGKTIITVLAGQSTSDAGVEDMIDEMIAEKFPQVQLEWECVDWGEKFDSQMQGRIAAGDIPDIIVGKTQDVYAYAATGNLAPLTHLKLNQMDETAKEIVTMDGNLYGLPYNAWYQGVIYNKDLFKRYQLTPPQSIEELYQIVEILEQNGVTPFAAHFQESWKVGNMTMQFMINEVFAKEANWGELFRKGQVQFTDNPDMIFCLEQNNYILEHSWKDALMLEQYESDRRFSEGEAAMYLTGSWSLQSMNQHESTTQYGIFPYPNRTGDAKLIKETNMTFMMSNTSKQQELVEEIFTELLQNQKLMQEILGFTQTYSLVKDVPVSYGNSVEEEIENYKKTNEIIEAAVGNNQLIWEYQNELAERISKWMREEISLQEVLAYADKHRMESSNESITGK